MFIKNLSVTNFRNYTSGQFEFSQTMNAIVGKNGIGKTNLMDAIYYLCMTNSYFTRVDRYIIHEGEDFSRLKGNFQKLDKAFELVAKVGGGKKKTFESNSKKYDRMADHIGLFPVVFVAPKDIEFLLEGSTERRKILDSTISQLDKDYLLNLIRYNSLLRQRNAYLKQTSGFATINKELLATYAKKMEGPSSYIHLARKKFVDEFGAYFQQSYAEISGKQEEVIVSYKSQLEEQSFIELLDKMFEKDVVLKRSNGGIHKDDLKFSISNKTAKNYASQGQLKSMVLAIKLSQYQMLQKKTEGSPILLLDDVFAKLDDDRVGHLLNLLDKKEVGQVFVTHTDYNRLEKIFKRIKIDHKLFMLQEDVKEESVAYG